MSSRMLRALTVHFVAAEILAAPLVVLVAVVGPMAIAKSHGLGTMAEMAFALAGGLALAAAVPLYLRLTRNISLPVRR